MTGYSGPPFGWTVPPGYTFTNLGRCASCRADIAWALTAKGNRAPLDPTGGSHFASCPNAADHRRPKAPKPDPEPWTHADGETYRAPRDHDRLRLEMVATRAFMSDHRWHQPDDIVAAVRRASGLDCDWAGVSARVRDLRKPENGGWGSGTVERRYVERGLYEYRYTTKPEVEDDPGQPFIDDPEDPR